MRAYTMYHEQTRTRALPKDIDDKFADRLEPRKLKQRLLYSPQSAETVEKRLIVVLGMVNTLVIRIRWIPTKCQRYLIDQC